MEDLTSSNLQLILGIKEGFNFDRLQKPTIIIATLNGHCLESKKVQIDCNPQYTTDLTWEMDKNTMRKMRCNQTSIKVECFTINENSSREKFGYVLLSIRSAQIISQHKKLNIKTTWYNILGVRNDFNNCKPKLLLYLIIKEKDIKPISTIPKNEQLFQSNFIYSNITPTWIEKEQLIQLGSLATCQDLFQINIKAETATNLSQLQGFKENDNNEFYFMYNIFDTFIRLKPFKFDSDKIFLNEKTVIRIRTSLPTLMNFLKMKSHFSVELKNKNITLGLSEVNLKPLISTSCLQEFKQINKNAASSMNHYCILKYNCSKVNIGDYRKDEHIDKLPSLNIYINLQYIESKNIFNEENSLQMIMKKKEISNYLEEKTCNVNHLGMNSQITYENLEFCSGMPYVSCRKKVIHSPKSFKHVSLQSKDNKIETIDVHRSYCLNIHLNEIIFFYSKPDVKNIEFRFYDLQDKIITTVYNDISIIAKQTIKLENINCKTYFVSTSDKIKELLTIFTPKIIICDVTSKEIKCIAHIFLNPEIVFYNKMPEYQCQASLIDCNSYKKIGYVIITKILEDYGTFVLMKTIKEKNSAYKIVDELETWKERQKEIFKYELQKKEEAHLTLLNQEWQRHRDCLESKLVNSVKQCKILANDLNKTIENIQVRKIQGLEKEIKLIQENEKLQWKYDHKLYQLQNTLQKMQEEFSTKLMALNEQNQNLTFQIESLSEKKCELEKIKTGQAEKLEAYKKVFLNKDQTESVFQKLKNLEKLINVEKSKSFFKEQWDKAVKEIHKIKVENQKALEFHIKNSKKELDNLDLEEILHADSTALTYDQIALNEIQQEIDVINPKTTMQDYNTINTTNNY